MGALSSRMPWNRAGRAPEEPGAPEGEEEAEEVAVAAIEEGEESEEAGPTTSQGRHKRKTGPGGQLTKASSRKRTKDSLGSVYETLFLRGEGSDVQIRALGEEWNLHKVYLCESGYFASMFSGAWRETTMNTIELQMPDENIDCQALHEALGSLYRDSVLIPHGRVVPMLAIASMLQLDKLIEQCGEIMKETLSDQTVCSYYYSAESYGLQNIRAMCLQWLLDNLMTQHSEELLREVSLDLMKEVIGSSELFVMEVEMDVYTTLKKWVFLQLQPTWRGPHKDLLPDADSWFAGSRRESEGTPFLETEQGRAFVPAFQQLRLAYIIFDLPSVHVINRDALIPATWLTPVYKEQWLALLRAEQTRGLGPVDVHVSDLQRTSMRCGGQLLRDEQCSWRWAGFNFGWDLVVCYANRRIIFKRSAQNRPYGLGVSLLWQRKVAFRLRLASLDRAGRAIFRRETDYQVLSLGRNQELEVVNLENEDVVFPIYVTCNFLYLSERGVFLSEDP
ncbi:LOW QUALITY PROTEIN: germ cell-less protein-like 1 [Moschus berezovskii]|uniref:LOW QUALITY PROTEIN: germ cell-less protein-like 1 n=1 Tax=Moschus berezovskii TaxID=68408 RepID=UPI002444F104|nr:LOW QUALITY PROTEIN: germ cell-less protein-like 1 [Moschus berezovskii]